MLSLLAARKGKERGKGSILKQVSSSNLNQTTAVSARYNAQTAIRHSVTETVRREPEI
jgi:hypothetical protein